MGISDIIAGFIQQELEEAGGALELQRSDLAQRFNCVPSQINYVMSTRFSPEHGYIVESRKSDRMDQDLLWGRRGRACRPQRNTATCCPRTSRTR